MRAYLQQAVRTVDHRQNMALYLFYLAATILPGGVLLVLLRWIWLRLHM
jgi:hypothetical protein